MGKKHHSLGVVEQCSPITGAGTFSPGCYSVGVVHIHELMIQELEGARLTLAPEWHLRHRKCEPNQERARQGGSLRMEPEEREGT